MPRRCIDAPLEVGDIADRELVTGLVKRYGSRLRRALRRLQGGRRVDGSARALLRQQRGPHRAAPRRAPRGGRRPRRVLLVVQRVRLTRGTPGRRGPTRPGPRARTRRASCSSSACCAGSTSATALRSVSLRYFNAAGASVDARLGEDSPRPLNLVPLAMQAALGQIPALSVYGTDYPTPDGTAIRDYIHVDDLADAHVRALGYLEQGGASTALNVGHRARLVGARSDRRHEAGERRRCPGGACTATTGRPDGRVRRQPARA